MTTRCRKRRKISTGSRASQSTLTYWIIVFLYIDYCMIQLNARNYAWNKRKHDTAQHSCVRHLGNALDKRDWRWHLTSAFSQRLRKYTNLFSNLCVYGERFHRLRVDGRPKRIKKFALLAFAFTIVFVSTGPEANSFNFRLTDTIYSGETGFKGPTIWLLRGGMGDLWKKYPADQTWFRGQKKFLQGAGGIAVFVWDNISLQCAGKNLDISVFSYILL